MDNQSLEEEIISLLRQGIDLPDETLSFAASTYGLSPSTIGEALSDRNFEEREVLLSLLLTPGYAMREALEPHLSEVVGPIKTHDQLATAVSSEIQTITVRPPGGEAFVLDVGREEITYFIDKLYLEREIDPSIDKAVRRVFSAGTVLSVRLILRCRGDKFSSKKRDFLVHFIDRCESYEEKFIELFSLLLTLVAEVAADGPIEEYLLEHKRSVVETIRKIRLFEKKRERYSMEYLMMQRYPVPHESEEEMLNRLYLLTTITETILGLPPEPLVRPDHKELGHFRSAADIEQLINDLSSR